MAIPFELAPSLPSPPDAHADAHAEADRLSQTNWSAQRAIKNISADAPKLNQARLIEQLTVFHQERMQRVPDACRFPESPMWVDYIRQRDCSLQDACGMSGKDLAVLRSLYLFMAFRGWRDPEIAGKENASPQPPPPNGEHCRVAYLAESTWGEVHFKNVDNPLAGFAPRPIPEGMERPQLVCDGVGSGMHMDIEPADLFPLEPRRMMLYETGDTPGAVEFLTKYRDFWGGCNVLIYDRDQRAAAIEKSSYSQLAVFQQNSAGAVHISGMVCRDPESEQAQHLSAMRQQYLTRFGLSRDGPDHTFWQACDQAEGMLSEALNPYTDSQPINAEKIWQLFRTPWPKGLSKEGDRLHPNQTVEEYTLTTYAICWEKKHMRRVQRDPQTGRMPSEEERFQF